MKIDPVIAQRIRQACEETALAGGLSIAPCEILSGADLSIRSDGERLYLSQEIHSLETFSQFAYLGLALHFHDQIAQASHKAMLEPQSWWARLKAYLFGFDKTANASARESGEAIRANAGSHVTVVTASRLTPEQLEQARSRAIANLLNARLVAPKNLLQVLLMVQASVSNANGSAHGATLFEDEKQLLALVNRLEEEIETSPLAEASRPLAQASQLLRLAYKTSYLIDSRGPSAKAQVAGLNRLYSTLGEVGSLALVINKLSSNSLSDPERVNVLLEILTQVNPQNARLALIDFAASKLQAQEPSKCLALSNRLREELSQCKDLSMDTQILAWTLLSLFRQKLLAEDPQHSRTALTEKIKRRCLSELFFVASELGTQDTSISARALRDKLDSVCEAIEIARPASSPDEFQAAAWIEAMEELSQFTLHETLCILDGLAEWGQENLSYQVWMEALCQRLKVQRELSMGDQYGEGQPKALQAAL